MGQATSSQTHHQDATLQHTQPPPSSPRDYTSDIPDEMLALIFSTLPSSDRKRCSSVCRRWLAVEGQSRHRLSLNASAELGPHIPSLLTRFDSITKLSLRCDRKSISIGDGDLELISLKCPNLTRLKLRSCREVTTAGMLSLGKNCKSLLKLSCGSSMFGAKGMNALLDNCPSLEELSVKRLRGVGEDFTAEPIGLGSAAGSLKSITLKELYNGQSFGPIIMGSKNLNNLKIFRCLGDWDGLLEGVVSDKKNCNSSCCLSEIHLERLQVSDIGLMAVAKCPNLEVFHLVKAPDCSDQGIVAIAENCGHLRKLHIDGWRTNRIGEVGLISLARNCSNLVELVLIGLNISSLSLTELANGCRKLERLALCGSETIGDPEIYCVAAKFVALKKLCIKGCRVTDEGIEAFAWGCPNLVKIKVRKCRGVTGEVADWLRARRVSLSVNIDYDEVEQEAADFDDGVHDDRNDVNTEATAAAAASMSNAEVFDAPSTSSAAARRSSSKLRFGLFAGRNIVSCAFRRLSAGNDSGNNSSSNRL